MTEESKTTVVLQRYSQPFHVSLTRGQRGNYGWSIEVHGEDRDAVLYEIDQIDEHMRGRYLNAQTEPKASRTIPFEHVEDPHSRVDQTLHNIKGAGEKLLKGGERSREK